MSRPDQWNDGRRNGIKWAVYWLHAEAEKMNDPSARGVLHNAAFHMGSEAKLDTRPRAALEAVLPDLTRLPVEIDERALEEAAKFVADSIDACAGMFAGCDNDGIGPCVCRRDARAAITAYGRALVEGK